MKKILFLHGFYASGSCETASALRNALEGKATVLSPDLPQHPAEALAILRTVIDREKPDLLVGNSCGAFYAQMLAPVVGIPALLGNPHFAMSGFLRERLGRHEFKSPRQDGIQEFVIDDTMVGEFAAVESIQFDCCSPYYRDKVWGIFGDNDTLARFEPVFSTYYINVLRFPGGHTPTPSEVKEYYAPLALRMLEECPVTGERRFRHFKGGMYRYRGTALDSENLQRMVVYQALYGERGHWIRPEKMFFETIERDGRRFPRFTEVDSTGDMTHKVKITAVRKIQYDDLMAQFENPIEHTCDVCEGQSWVSVAGQCPDGLCPEAWKTMREFVQALARGEGNFFDGWMKNPRSAMISCNDGFRPVSFYIETIN